MPAGQPFTHLCRSMASHRRGARVDLHLHTTYSDGLYTPAQVVDLARRSGMPAVAITDHDTLAGIAPARQHAAGRIQIIPGVEISTEFQGRELHLLAYFMSEAPGPLQEALDKLQAMRRARFFAMIAKLAELGIQLNDDNVQQAARCGALGRRHLAQLLVNERKSANIREAFQRYLGDWGRVAVPKERIPTSEAIALVREAGGVSAWAHPGSDCTWESLQSLYNFGMRALECDWPTVKHNRSRELRQWAKKLGLVATAGSDCHGPDEPKRTIGARGITMDDVEKLRAQTIPV